MWDCEWNSKHDLNIGMHMHCELHLLPRMCKVKGVMIEKMLDIIVAHSPRLKQWPSIRIEMRLRIHYGSSEI